MHGEEQDFLFGWLFITPMWLGKPCITCTLCAFHLVFSLVYQVKC